MEGREEGEGTYTVDREEGVRVPVTIVRLLLPRLLHLPARRGIHNQQHRRQQSKEHDRRSEHRAGREALDERCNQDRAHTLVSPTISFYTSSPENQLANDVYRKRKEKVRHI